jgi:flagellar motility protein MotE (MotC chaperone)
MGFPSSSLGLGDPGPADEGSKRLAKIFGSMDAEDAAKVLEQLNDDEVRSILFHMSDRKAAEILGNFSPERAANLSRTVLDSDADIGS